MGRDCIRRTRRFHYLPFQSTRPAWGATYTSATRRTKVVSIHAPRVGRDEDARKGLGALLSFNPRAPRGARHSESLAECVFAGFNPRAPRGARRTAVPIRRSVWRFQSTRPAWGATMTSIGLIRQLQFQSTRPAWGATKRHGSEY